MQSADDKVTTRQRGVADYTMDRIEVTVRTDKSEYVGGDTIYG